jgi:hypothetical protein
MRSLHYLNGGTLSPFPAEPEQYRVLTTLSTWMSRTLLIQAAARHIIGLIYNLVMENSGFFSQEFAAAIVSAGARARLETLKAGVPVFYRDWKRNLDVMEQPDGRKFEVCFIAGAPRETNYRVIRELDGKAA